MTQFDEQAMARIGNVVRFVESMNLTGNLPYASTGKPRGTFSKPALITEVGTWDLHKIKFTVLDYPEDTTYKGHFTPDDSEVDEFYVLDLSGQQLSINDVVWVTEHNGRWYIPAGGGASVSPVVSISIIGKPNQGTFKISHNNADTSTLEWTDDILITDSITDIETKLEALTSIDVDSITAFGINPVDGNISLGGFDSPQSVTVDISLLGGGYGVGALVDYNTVIGG